MNTPVILTLAAVVLLALVWCIAAARRRRLVTAAVVAVMSLAAIAITFVATLTPAKGPFLNGGLTLKGGPSVRFYVGEKLVGAGNVFLTWDDLVKSDTKQPREIKWEPQASFDVFKQDHHGAVTERLGGPGAVFILRDNEFKNGYGKDFHVMGEQILLRRADGVLDRVLVLYANLRTADGQRASFLVPIRVRQDHDYLVTKPEDGVGGIRGRYIDPPLVRPTLNLSGTFVTGAPPKELAEEIKERGLWEPNAR